MIESPVRDRWKSSPLPDPSDEWEIDHPFSNFVRALVNEQAGWQTDELPPRSVSYVDEQITSLRERYEFRNEATVEDFLGENPFLFDLLVKAHDKIREYFGSDVQAVSEMVKGFEADDDERLFVFIQTELSSDEALDRLDELYERWWLDALSGVRPKFSIDVEFV